MLALALMLSLAAAQTPADPFADVFLPAFEYAKHPVEHWMQEFEKSEGKSTDALWCIYYCDRRTSEVLDFLHRWRGKLPDPQPRPSSITGNARNVAREIEAILIDWNVLRDPLPPQWPEEGPGRRIQTLDGDVYEYVKPRPHEGDPDAPYVELPSGLFARPTRLSSASEADLLADLGSTDRSALAAAAVTLIARDRQLDRALQALMHRVTRDGADHARDWGAWSDSSYQTNELFVYSGLSRWREPWDAHVIPEWAMGAWTLGWALRSLGTAAVAPIKAIRSTGEGRANMDRALAQEGLGPMPFT